MENLENFQLQKPEQQGAEPCKYFFLSVENVGLFFLYNAF